MTLILGIETSCDETAAAVVRDGRAVLTNIVASQHALHQRYAGVVPEIASRAHLQRITPVIEAALRQAACGLTDLSAIAVGNRPGLVGSLIVGVSAAKTLAWATGKPLIGVDHVRAHLHAAMLYDVAREAWGVGRETPTHHITHADAERGLASEASGTPHAPRLTSYNHALGLVVSGGHTTLYHLTPDRDPAPLGRTIDDALGEAYDKAAVILGAGYPGGQRLDELAQRGDATAPGIPKLPVSMLEPGSLDFSFSGLKTALLYAVRGQPVGRGKAATFSRGAADLSPSHKANLAAAFQHAAVDAVVRKLGRAATRLADQGQPPESLVLGGGVSANSLLRQRVRQFGEKHRMAVHLPALSYCVDNAAMIAGFAHAPFERGAFDDLSLPVVATTRA